MTDLVQLVQDFTKYPSLMDETLVACCSEWKRKFDKLFRWRVDENRLFDEDVYYKELIKKANYDEQVYKDMVEASIAFSKESLSYIHRNAFAMICTSIQITKKRVEFIKVPAGSGKSFLALLLHKIFTKNGAIVVPQEHNKLQFKNLTLVDSSVPVLTMAEALQQQDQFDEFVIDDAEVCILNHGTYKDLNDNTPPLKCFYQILDKKQTFLITSSEDEKFIKVLVDLKFVGKDEITSSYNGVFVTPYKQAKINHEIFEDHDQLFDRFKKQVITAQGYAIVICKSSHTLARIIHSKEFLKFKTEPIIYGKAEDFDKDPYELIDGRRFLFVKAEFAQGIHLFPES